MTNASRAPVDLDALARDLRQDKGQPRPAGGAKADPLAELARIVGQDDPFRALLAARQESQNTHGETEPGPDRRVREAEDRRAVPAAEAPPAWDAGRVEPRFAAETPSRANPADAFDQYLASVEQDTHAESAHGVATAEADAESYEEGRALRWVRPRRRLASVAAGVGVVAVAIAGALTYKGLHGSSGGGGVPVVQADTAPLKVEPKVADGIEIPDQNRQIYDRKPAAKDGQIRIVNREEQPMDVAEAARAAQAQSGSTSAGQGTTPGSGPFEAFGEPRRVRTVAVKPDTPPAPREAQAEAAPSPIPTMVLPTDSPPAAKPVRPVRAAAAIPAAPSVATQAPAEAAPVQEAPPPAPVQTQKPKPAKAAQRVAAVSPETTAATDAAAAASSESPAVSEGPVGGFAVQLGVRNSAADARAAFREMQGKYSQLAGKPELIRQAEVNGKTIYRVRVGPLGKAEASGLCSALQGAGGQCFVAKN